MQKRLPSFNETSPLPGFDETEPVTTLPAFDETAPLPAFEDTQEISRSAEQFSQTGKGTALTTQAVTDDELKKIAQTYNVPPEKFNDLKDYVLWAGGQTQELKQAGLDFSPENLKKAFKSAAGFVGQNIGIGIPQKIYRSLQDKQTEQALDAINDLVSYKQSYATDIAGIASGIGTGIGLAKLTRAALPAKTAAAVELASPVIGGAGAGVGQSEQGQELEGALFGGALGAVIPSFIAIKKAAQALPIDFSINRTLQEETKRFNQVMPDVSNIMQKTEKEMLPVYTGIVDKIYSSKELTRDILESDGVPLLRSYKTFTKWGDEFINKLAQITEKTPPEDAKLLLSLPRDAVTNKLTPEGLELARRYLTIASTARKLSKGKIKGIKDFNTTLSRQGPEYVAKTLAKKDATDAALKYISDENFKYKLPGIDNNFVKKAAVWFMDGKPLQRMLDYRYGTDFELKMDAGSRQNNKLTLLLKAYLPEVNALKNVDSEDFITKYESGQVQNAELKQLTDKLREQANLMGIPIAERANYVPSKYVPFPQYVNALQKAVQEHAEDLDKLSELNGEELQKYVIEGPPKLRELINELGGMSKNQRGSELEARIRQNIADRRGLFEKHAMEAASSIKREGQIPSWLRDTNVKRVLNKWINDTFRTAMLRDTIADIENQAKIADKFGDASIAKYLRNLKQDLLGTRQGTLATFGRNAVNNFLIQMRDIATNEDNSPLVRAMAEGAELVPEVISELHRNIYPAFLGLSPSAALQNLISPLVMNIPEMPVGYGVSTSLRAAKETADTLAKGKLIKLSPEMAARLSAETGTKYQAGQMFKTNSPSLIMENSGQFPTQWTGEMVEALRDGVAKNKYVKLSREAIDKFNKAAMFLFEASEATARNVSYNMGQQVGQDLIAGNPASKEFLRNLASPAYKRAIIKAISDNKPEKVKDLVSEYFISTNMLNYDRINMSEYGRFMGPLFSVFSKWPTNVAGRVAQALMSEGREAGGARILKTLVAPFAILEAADQLITDPAREESAALGRVLPAAGLSGMTPLPMLENLARGDILSSPGFQTISQVGEAGFSGDPDKIKKVLYSMADAYIPVYSLMARILTKDIPAYLNDEKRVGSPTKLLIEGE